MDKIGREAQTYINLKVRLDMYTASEYDHQRAGHRSPLETTVESFVSKACAIAWPLTLLPQGAYLEQAEPDVQFNEEFFTRHSHSKPRSIVVQEARWPALLQNSQDGDEVKCLSKGIVLTVDQEQYRRPQPVGFC